MNANTHPFVIATTGRPHASTMGEEEGGISPCASINTMKMSAVRAYFRVFAVYANCRTTAMANSPAAIDSNMSPPPLCSFISYFAECGGRSDFRR